MKNPKFRQALTDVIHAAGAADGSPKGRGALLYQVAGKVRVISSSARVMHLLGAASFGIAVPAVARARNQRALLRRITVVVSLRRRTLSSTMQPDATSF